MLRQKLYDTEKNNQRMHASMISLEENVRELRTIANGKVQRKEDKAQEIVSTIKKDNRLQMNAAEDKIEELAKANAFLSKAKDKQVQLTTKTKQQYAR